MEITFDNLNDMCAAMCDNFIPPEEHEFCLRCNRKLKSKKSRILGYGPSCFKKHNKELKGSLFKTK